MKRTTSPCRKILVIATLALLLLTLVACSGSDTRTWIEQNFNFKVNVQTESLSTHGVTVSADKWISGDYTSAQLTTIDTYISQEYPNVTKQSGATVKYNCHSYAWYSTSSSNIYWINDPATIRAASTYITLSSSFTNTIPTNARTSGYMVDYYVDSSNRPHSAQVYSSTKFVSKWGPFGVYVHSPKDVPPEYSCNNLGYYKW